MKNQGFCWGTSTTGILVGMLVLIVAGGCKEEIKRTAGWTDEELTIDGRFDDWNDSWTSYFPEQGAVIGLAGDSAFLYALVRFRDPKWARTIKMSGLELAFDVAGKKRKNFVLKYRGGPTPDQMRRAGGGMIPPDSLNGFPGDGFPGGLRPGDLREFTCYVKDRIEEKSVPVDGSEGPRAAFDIDQGFYTYEFALPLERGAVRYYGLGAEPGQTISIGAVWGDMTRTRGQMGKRDGMGGIGGLPGGGTPGGGMSGGGLGGGMDGGPPGGRGGRRPNMPEKQEVWFKVTLASPAVASRDNGK